MPATSTDIGGGNTIAQRPVANVVPTRSGLTWRIFIGSASIVAVVLAVTLTLMYLAAHQQANSTLQRELDATSARVNSSLDVGSRELIDKAKIYVSNPNIRAEIEQTKDSGEYLDLAQTMAQEIGASWVQLVDRAGIRLARSDQPAAERLDLSASRLVSDPLDSETSKTGFGLSGGSTLFYAVGVPILGAGGKPVGVVMASQNISDTLASQLKSETGSELVFFALDSTGAMQVVATSPGITDRAALKAALEPAVLGHSAGDASSADSAATERGADPRGVPMREGAVGGVHYAWLSMPIAAAGGRVIGGIIALRNKDVVLAQFKKTRMLILGLGLLSLLVAFAVSLAIARQITRPVRALVVATSRASEGDYAAEIPASGTDEIGSLASAFRQLLSDLREKQAVVEFLQNPSGGKTVPFQTLSPTMRTMMEAGAVLLEPGQVLASRYEIKSILGVGGMGMVYKAVDRELGEIVAVKTLKPDMMKEDPAALDRFRSEIRLARRISHRNVVRTHDIGESGGLYYITMEFVEGKSLKELIVSRGKLPTAAVLPIAKQLCRALDVAHEAGVIHRDIKPQNMVVEPDGVLKVMDFGIARLAQRNDGHTQAGTIVGTPEYMAPEQLLGESLDGRADIYAVGVVLFECLTGRLPHLADTPISLISKVLDETPPAPRTLSEDIPAPLSDIVMRTLSKKPDQRPRSAADLLLMLDRV